MNTTLRRINVQLIHCKAIVLNETEYWAANIVRRAGGAIFRTYLVDVQKRARLCEMRPSYSLHPLYTTPLVDDEDGSLAAELATREDYDVIYMHCANVDRLPAGAVYDFGEQEIPPTETRESMFRLFEHQARGNVVIEVPEGMAPQPSGKSKIPVHSTPAPLVPENFTAQAEVAIEI
ncbi:hypothetical protein LA345_40765 (plasmid) [Burkholderia vietnamiensis]|nr:hypothetical protein [Burkholderia vietnamiensis]